MSLHFFIVILFAAWVVSAAESPPQSRASTECLATAAATSPNTKSQALAACYATAICGGQADASASAEAVNSQALALAIDLSIGKCIAPCTADPQGSCCKQSPPPDDCGSGWVKEQYTDANGNPISTKTTVYVQEQSGGGLIRCKCGGIDIARSTSFSRAQASKLCASSEDAIAQALSQGEAVGGGATAESQADAAATLIDTCYRPCFGPGQDCCDNDGDTCGDCSSPSSLSCFDKVTIPGATTKVWAQGGKPSLRCKC